MVAVDCHEPFPGSSTSWGIIRGGHVRRLLNLVVFQNMLKWDAGSVKACINDFVRQHSEWAGHSGFLLHAVFFFLLETCHGW